MGPVLAVRLGFTDLIKANPSWSWTAGYGYFLIIAGYWARLGRNSSVFGLHVAWTSKPGGSTLRLVQAGLTIGLDWLCWVKLACWSCIDVRPWIFCILVIWTVLWQVFVFSLLAHLNHSQGVKKESAKIEELLLWCVITDFCCSTLFNRETWCFF